MIESPFHWEYSFYMHPGHPEIKSRAVGTRTVNIDVGLTIGQVLALRAGFKKHGFPEQEPDMEGFKLRGENDFLLNYRMWDLSKYQDATNFPVELITKKLDNDTLRIIFDIALSTNMILTDFVGKKVRFVATDPSPAQLERWGDAVRMDTIDDLRTWLTKDLGGREVMLEDENDEY